MPLTVTVKAAAEMTSLSQVTIWRMIARNEIASVKIGRRRLIQTDSLRQAVGAA